KRAVADAAGDAIDHRDHPVELQRGLARQAAAEKIGCIDRKFERDRLPIEWQAWDGRLDLESDGVAFGPRAAGELEPTVGVDQGVEPDACDVALEMIARIGKRHL